jgi:phosphatidylserine/phosphatidylglycerophosphate/cardiolipin synthase-like enzyme
MFPSGLDLVAAKVLGQDSADDSEQAGELMHALAAVLILAGQALPPEVHFSPRGGCTEAVVRVINEAKTEVLVAAYSFTSGPIGDALVRAWKHGVKIRCVVDRSQVKGKASLVKRLRAAGVDVAIDSSHSIFHDKYMVVDGAIVELGSFNYSAAAEISNAENCLVIKDAVLARRYAANWAEHRAHSK